MHKKTKFIILGLVVMLLIGYFVIPTSQAKVSAASVLDRFQQQDSKGQKTSDHCSPAYPDVCIPPAPPDLDCGDITERNFKVLAADPHRFDGDKDGIGCESN